MTIDSTGTKPGLPVPQTEATEKRHFMRCKREGCDSMEAIEVPYPAEAPIRMYRCIPYLSPLPSPTAPITIYIEVFLLCP